MYSFIKKKGFPLFMVQWLMQNQYHDAMYAAWYRINLYIAILTTIHTFPFLKTIPEWAYIKFRV